MDKVHVMMSTKGDNMNIFEKILYALQATMEEPVAWGWFHWIWIILIAISVGILYAVRNKFGEKQLKLVLGIYGIIAFVLEALKQLIWSFNYDVVTGIVTWDYQWYAFPFQLCTTPIFVCLICLFLEDCKVRKALLSYMAFVTILGSFMTVIIPDSCFTEDILINIHTMWLHCGSLVVSIYLLMAKEVEFDFKNLKGAVISFAVFICIAQILNIIIYNTGILKDETFNMFYISPYFISSLPVFDIIQKNVPYVIYLIIYIVILSGGACVICYTPLAVKKIVNSFKKI